MLNEKIERRINISESCELQLVFDGRVWFWRVNYDPKQASNIEDAVKGSECLTDMQKMLIIDNLKREKIIQ